MGIERRRNPRYRIDLDVIIHIGGGGRTQSGRTFDVSCAGAFVLCDAAITLGTRVDLMLAGDNGLESLYLSGTVVHCVAGKGIGVRFGEVSARASGRLAVVLAQLATSQAPMPLLAPQAPQRAASAKEA